MRMPKGVLVTLVVGLAPLAIAMAQGSGASNSAAGPAASMGNGHMMGGQMMTLNTQVNEIIRELEQNVTDLQKENDKNTIESKLVQQEALIEQLKSSLDGRCGMSMEMMGEGSGHMMGGSMMGSGMGRGNGIAGSGMQHSSPGSSSSQDQ